MDVMRSWTSVNWDPVGSGKHRHRRRWNHRYAHDDGDHHHRCRPHQNRRRNCDGDDRLDHRRRANGWTSGTHADSPTDSISGTSNTDAPDERTRLGNLYGGGYQGEQ